MDSDLSLIEISGEDDSLLQPLTAGGGAVSSLGVAARGNTAEYFLCSPLQVPRTNSKPIEAASEGLGEAKSLFCSANKENFNVEKAEALKLSVEPQQMKRKKKGGGYNLRKSLAWDRAFFTDEGVLDAAELSMISGGLSKSSGQMLSAIEEESDSSFSDLQALEDNLFKELPPSTSVKTKENSGSLLPKKRNNEAAPSVATRKMLSTGEVNRSGSKRSASTRPAASTSLKRPANLVTTKTVKESKVSKLAVPKPSPAAPPPSRTAKNSKLIAGDSKQSQTTRPVNAQTNCGLKGLLNKSKSVPNNLKAGLAGKSSSAKISLGLAKRNVVSSVKCSPTTVQSTMNTEAQNDLGAIPNPTYLSGFSSSFDGGESGKSAIALPQNIQHTQIKTEKPTGLRRPSPSLGFFGRSKAPTLQNPSKLTSLPCNVAEANISILRKPASSASALAQRPPLAPKTFTEVSNYGTTIGNIKTSSSSSRYSVFSAVEPGLIEKVESNPQVANMQKVERKVVSNEKCYIAVQSQNVLTSGPYQQSLGKAGYATRATFEKKDITPQRIDECLLRLGTLQHLDKNDTSRKVIDGGKGSAKRSELENLRYASPSSSEMEGTDPLKSDNTGHQLADDKPHQLPLENHDVSSEFASINCIIEPLVEQAEVVNLSSYKADPISSRIQMLQESVADVSLNVQVSGVAEIEKLNAFSHHRSSTEQERDSALDKVETQSSMEDAGVQSLDINIGVNLSNSELSPLVNIQQNMVVSDVTQKPELLEFPESVLTRVEAFEDGVSLHVGDCLFGENNIEPEEAKWENVPPTDEREGTGACERDPVNSSDHSPVPVTLLDCRSTMAKRVECQKQDDSPAVELESYKLDTQFQHVIGPHDETTLIELGNTNHQLTRVVAAEDVNVSEQDISNITSAVSPITCGSSATHTVENVDVEDIKLNSAVEIPCPGSTSQPVENFCTKQEDYPAVQVCVSSAEEDVNKRVKGEEKEIIACVSEMKRTSSGEIQCAEANGLFFENTHSLEELRKLENGNSATVYLKVCSDEVSERDNHNLSLHEKMDHVVEESVEVNDVVNDQDEKFEFQFLVNQTKDDAKISVAGVCLNQQFQDDHNAEVFHEEKELGFQNCGDNEIGQMDNIVEVLNVENDFEKVLEQHDDHRIESKMSTSCAQVKPVVQGVNIEEHKEAVPLEVESVIAVISSLETEPPVIEHLTQNHEIGNNKLGTEAKSLKSDSWANQSDDEVSGKSILDREHKDATRDHKKTGDDKKQENLVIKPPTYAIPFSDEWLAAIEAAGEEILTKKSGAVQNSPQDRSQPEPSPWSPVKRKHNQPIGPFDCTKHTNH